MRKRLQSKFFWFLVAALIGVIVVTAISDERRAAEEALIAEAAKPAEALDALAKGAPEAVPISVDRPNIPPSGGAYMDARERTLYQRDPSSMGYPDGDRDFLREHGVTEAEARAAETILHQQGID